MAIDTLNREKGLLKTGEKMRSIPMPYRGAKLLPFFDHGWYRNGIHLERLILEWNVKTIIEVGCWFGESTRHMAFCLPEEGKLYAVDHWKGSSEHQEGGVHWHPELPMVYEYFLSNVIHVGLVDTIIPIQMESLEAAKILDVMADLIYIDASHDTPSVYADLVAWYPHLRPGGVFCGDDWDLPSVRKAVESFAEERGLSIQSSQIFWQVT